MATQPKPQAPWGEYDPFFGPLTVEQFEQLPATDGWQLELHAGRVIAVPGPGSDHADIQDNFAQTLGAFLRANQLGRLSGTGCYNLPLPGTTEELLCPDLSYVVPARKAAMPRRGSYLVGAPDLVIEIASPSDSHPAMLRKVGVYLRAGVPLVWVVWPATQTIDIWRPAQPQLPTATVSLSDMLDGQEVIPGFQCPVAGIFELD